MLAILMYNEAESIEDGLTVRIDDVMLRTASLSKLNNSVTTLNFPVTWVPAKNFCYLRH